MEDRNMKQEDEDEEDEVRNIVNQLYLFQVLAEFDICLTGKMKDNLHLLQYPLRPNYRPYRDQGELTKVEIGLINKIPDMQQQNKFQEYQQPKVKVIEDNLKFHFKLNKQTQNYDPNAVDHRISNHQLVSERVSIGSSDIQPNYCIGLFQNGQLILTPLKNFHQLRPSFEHVDQERASRMINAAQIHQEQQQALAKIQRVGNENQSGRHNVREWKELQFYSQTSRESEKEFDKLSQFGLKKLQQDDEDMIEGKGYSILSKIDYLDQVAPLDNTMDYSTAALNKNKGENLTIDQLAQLNIEQMILAILKKAGIIDYETLLVLMKSACKLSKQEMPKQDVLTNRLVQHFCYVTETGSLILKSELKYDEVSQRRQISLRDYTIQSLIKTKGIVDLNDLMSETDSKFTELKFPVNEISIYKDQTCTLRKFPQTQFLSLLSEQNKRQIATEWKKLDKEIQRHKEKQFYKDQSILQQINTQSSANRYQSQQQKALRANLISKIYKFFQSKPVCNYQQIMMMLEESKDLKGFSIEPEFLLQIMNEITISMGSSMYLNDPQHQEKTEILVNLLNQFSSKEAIKKTEVKKQLVQFVTQGKIDVSDKEITTIINTYCENEGPNIKLKKP